VKILLIHQAFASPKEAGGTRHYEFAQHCLRAGNQFSIVASDLSYATGARVEGARGLVTEQAVNGVRVLRAYTLPCLHRSFAWRIVSFLSFTVTSALAGLRAGPVDVVMGTSPPIFQAASAWLVSALRRKPFLLEIRDLWPEFAINMGVLKNPLLILLSRWLERFLYWRATHILVNSPAYRDYLIHQRIDAAKVSLISNGVDPDMFQPEAKGERIRKEFGLDGKFVVTYAGALGLANDIPVILKAAERLRDDDSIRFLLVGDGKERPKMEQMGRELKLQNVIFAGARPKSEMPDFLAASSACLATLQNIPMFKTTYPNKVFDYMAAGRPTILGIDGVIRNVMDACGGGIFVQPGSGEAIANAILSLRDNPQKAEAMGRAARNHVVRNFNRKQQAQAFVELLQQLTHD
jgi:glycosyltransferase involved in cell wall biosynthesis